MQFIKKPFEIPYNFDKKLVDFLNIYNNFDIHCIFLPPWGEDYPYSAKYGIIQSGKEYNYINFPDTRQEYEEHLKYINIFFPKKIMLLLQSNSHILLEDKIQYYISLGISKFCVGSIEQAEIIHNIIPEAEIMGSISMKIEPELLNNHLELYKQLFDSFVLWFPFNRDFKRLQNLPKDFKYSLLINCSCSIFCDGTHHWFISKEDASIGNFNCPHKIDPDFYMQYKNIIRIRPDHLYLFDNYISYFKLQGRLLQTNQIIQDIVVFTTDLNLYRIFEKSNIQQDFKF